MIVTFQTWLVKIATSATGVRALMHSVWMWPVAESLHFIGLTLLIGSIGMFDLRLLGLGRRIPVAAMHRTIRWGLLGFAINVITGLGFVLAEPDQYIYNPSFHFKVLFIAAAGLNALTFYLTTYRQVTAGPATDLPRRAKLIGAFSISMWLLVIVAGRLLTFYRPYPCGPEGPGTIATCIPGFGPSIR